MSLILYSFVSIALGVLLLGAGVFARYRGHPYERYLLGGGGLLVVVGVLELLYFVIAWELAHR